MRRYGFHGLSYEYIAQRLRELDPELARGRVVVCHLGSGASMCAIHAGRSVDSTMGFTAVDGLPMGTRTGQLDPGVVLYLLQSKGWDAERVERFLYHEGGLKGLSGVSNDMRDLLASEAPGAKLAVDYFVHRVVRETGALAAAMGGIDGLVFTAGIGERSPEIRARVVGRLGWLGAELDAAANAAHGRRGLDPGQPPQGPGRADRRGADDRTAHAGAGARQPSRWRKVMRLVTNNTLAGALGLALLMPQVLWAQAMIYPNAGQTPAQLDQDRTACETQAAAQSGYHPSQPAATPAPTKPRAGQRLAGAARGAAAGAVAEEVREKDDRELDNPSQAGARAGAVVGGLRQRQGRREDRREAQQQQAAQSQKQGAFNQGFNACMATRSYTIQ